MDEKEKLEVELKRIKKFRVEFNAKHEPEYRKTNHYKETMIQCDFREKNAREKLDRLEV